MSLVESVLNKRERHKEELEEEIALGEEKPKRSPGRPKGIARKMRTDGSKPRDEMAVIHRLSESFCIIMETPQLVRKISEETFSELVAAEVAFFKYLCSKHMDEFDDLDE